MPTRRHVLALIVGTAATLGGCSTQEEAGGKDGATGAPTRAAPDSARATRAADRILAGGVVPRANGLSAPHPATLSPETGANLFSAMNCDGCHGGGAVGWVGPSLVDGRWRYGGSDEEIFTSIYYGRPKGMPAFGGVMGSDAVWMLVSYIKAQPIPSVVPTTSWLPGGNAAATTAAEEKASPSPAAQAKSDSSAP